MLSLRKRVLWGLSYLVAGGLIFAAVVVPAYWPSQPTEESEEVVLTVTGSIPRTREVTVIESEKCGPFSWNREAKQVSVERDTLTKYSLTNNWSKSRLNLNMADYSVAIYANGEDVSDFFEVRTNFLTAETLAEAKPTLFAHLDSLFGEESATMSMVINTTLRDGVLLTKEGTPYIAQLRVTNHLRHRPLVAGGEMVESSSQPG